MTGTTTGTKTGPKTEITTAHASPFAARITGTGSAFPRTIRTNQDLEKMVETNDAWVQERTGIKERRIAVREDASEHNSSLGLRASLAALEMSGKRPEDIDLILYATCTPDTLLPSTACWLQMKIGAKRAWAMDLNAACSGFVYALATAEQFLKSGQHQTVLVVGGEVISPFIDWKDRGICILFGDGAGAAVVERVAAQSEHRILTHHVGSDGHLWELFHIPAGGSNLEVTPERYEKRLNTMQMKGKEIFKVAVKTLEDYAVRALESQGLGIKDLDWIVPHQANLRIIEAVAKRLNFPMEKVIINLDRYGNTSAATVPTALDEAVRQGKIKSGDLVLLDVFGSGLTFGSMLMRW